MKPCAETVTALDEAAGEEPTKAAAEAFLAQMHRRRFAAARQQHPCACASTLTQALEGGDLWLPVARFAGLAAMRFVPRHLELASRPSAHPVCIFFHRLGKLLDFGLNG